MEHRAEYEADLFRRYESRLVTLEMHVEALNGFKDTYRPIVDGLRDAQLIAEAVAEKMSERGRVVLTRVQIIVAILALILPPALAASFTYLITTQF